MIEDKKNSYALALFSLAKETSTIEKFKNQILDFYLVIKKNDQFLKIMKNFDVFFEDKKAIIDQIFKNEVEEFFVNFLKILVEKNETHLCLPVIKKTIKLINQELDIKTGIIYSTIDIDSTTIKLLNERVEKIFGKKVELENHLDHKLIGGFKIVVDNIVIDRSILRQINELKEKLIKASEGK